MGITQNSHLSGVSNESPLGFFSAIGRFQFAALESAHRLEPDAYGMAIRNDMEIRHGKEIHMPQVYAALSRLAKLGLVSSHVDKSRSAGLRGGARRFYKIEAPGLRLLNGDALSSDVGASNKETFAYDKGNTASTA